MKQNKRNSVYLLVRRVCRIVQHTVTLVTQLCLRLFRLHSHRRHIPLVRGVLGGVFVVVLATLLCTLLHPQATSAATGTEQEMSFEGKIVTSAGLNIPDGNYNMEFKIYTGCTNEPTSNTGCTAVWTEDYLTSNATYATTSPVTFTSGSYAVNLGSICSFSGGSCEGNTNTAINWDSYPLYLSLNIGTTAVCSAGFASCGAGDGAMNPYVLLTSAPYAMNAANSNEVGGDTLSQLGVLAANNTWTGNNIMQASTNSVGALQVENAAGNAALTVDTTDSTVNVIGESAAPTYVNDWEAHATNQATVSVSPATLGDLMVLAANIGTTGVTVTSVSGGGVSNWHQVKTNTGLAHQEIWEGTVTSTGSSTITLTYSSTPGVSCDLDAEEFTAGLGANTNWFITTATNFNNVSSATITYPSLTPTQPNGLYWAYARSASSGVAGSTSGFSYKVTGASNVVTYDPSLTAGTAYSPTATNSPAAVSEGVAMIISSSLGGLNVDNTLQVGGASTFDSNVSVRAGNSTTAFQVQNTTGSTVFNVDTTDQQISADQNTSSTVLPTMSLIQNGSSSSTLALQNNATSSAFYLSNNASNSNALTINSYTAAVITTPPAEVQSNSSATSATASSMSLAFSSNNTFGNTIVVAAQWNGVGLTPTCSDTQGNAYSTMVTVTNSSVGSQAGICYASSVKAGANTVTVNYGTPLGYRSLAIVEYSGIAASSPVDTSSTNWGTGTSGTNGYTSNASTTTSNGDMIFGFVADLAGTAATASPGTGFAQLTNNSGYGSPVLTEDQVQTTAGSIAATDSENQAHAYTGMMMAFKAATSGVLTNTDANALFTMSQSGQLVLQNSTNSTAAFQVKTSASGTNSTVFNVDTTDQQISADQNTSSTVLPTMSLIQNGSSSSTLALQNNATSSAFYLSNNASNSNALTINSYTAATTISATPTAVQYTSVAATASATTQTLAFSSNNTAGNTIVVAVSWNTTSGLTPVCSDSQGNTYSAVFTETDAANNSQSGICYASNIKAGANTVTVTYPTSVAYRSLAIQEFSGITTTGPVVDTDAINTATGTSGTNGYTSNAATTTTSGDLVFGFFVDETGSTATATASTSPNLFAQLTDNTTLGSPVTTEDTVQTSAGSIAAIQNENQAHAYTGMMMAFKPSTVTGGSFTNTNTNGLLSMSQSGQATFKNSTNSTTAFQIQNSSSNTIFNVNTTAGGVTITNPVSTASPAITTQSSGWEWDNYNNTGGLTQLVVAPHAVGDIMLVGVYNEGEQITGISGGGVSNWQLVMNGGGTGPVYEGTVTSPGASIISIASTGSVTLAFGEIMAQEFSSAYGASTVWSVVATGSVSNASLGTATFPSLTTTAANQLYWGYAGVSSSFTTGNTCTPAGFTCKATAAGDFMAWDANTAANTQYTPVGTLNSSGTSSIQAMIITASPGSGIALNVNGSSQVTAASTTAFQVQNTTGTSVMNVDTQNNAIVLGADGSPQANVTVRGGMASGANTSGGNITFEASNGTGTGGSGSFVFQTAAPASSTTVQTDNSADAGTLNGTSSNPLTLSYTTGTEPNRLMVVQINSGCGNSVVSMTYNGITLSQLASDNTPSVDNTTCNAHTEVWDLVAPPSGTYNLVVTYAGNEGTAGVSTFYNVNQTAPIGPIATASGSTSGTQTTSLNVTATSSSQLVYDAIATDEGCQMVGGPSSGQTQLWEYNTCTGLYAGGSSSKPGTSGTVNMGWQTTTSDWTDVGFAINPITSTTADGLSNSLVIANNGAATFESATDSTGALDVLSAAGSFSVFDVDTTDDNVYIGTATDTNTTPALLVLNNYDTFTDPTTPTTCSSSSDLGALYYNDATNNVRACLAGSWQDLVSTASLAQLLFGVVPNSGSHSGDLIGASATATNASNTGGPCKVNYDGTGSVYVNSCLAYSGGREVSVAAQAVSLSGVAATSYDNLCLNSSGVPALVGGTSGTNGSETVNNLSTTNAITMGQPLLCLATILTGSASTLSKIYDVRTFTTTTKTYATITTAADAYLGAVVAPSGTSGEVVWAATLGGLVQGVIVASTGTAGSLGAPNVMIATAGPQWVFGSAGTLNNYVEATASGGVANTTATVADSYNILGVDLNTYGTSCAAQTYGATDCQYSLFTYLDIQ